MADSAREENITRTFNDAFNASHAKLVEIFAGFSIFLATASSVGNVVILSALQRVSSIYPPTKLFFQCLAVTDLCVGLIVQPLYTTSITSYAVEMDENVLHYIRKICAATSTILCGLSMLTTTAISVDRLLALMLGLRYRTVVTIQRVRFVITCIWIIMGSIAMIGLWKVDVFNRVTSDSTVLSLVTSTFSYVKIYFTIKKHQTQVQNDFAHGQPYVERFVLNIARYKKTVSSILWVQLALVACYAPYGIVAGMEVHHLAYYLVSSALVHLNSTLNPILYCWKIREVRKAVKDTITRTHCF